MADKTKHCKLLLVLLNNLQAAVLWRGLTSKYRRFYCLYGIVGGPLVSAEFP